MQREEKECLYGKCTHLTADRFCPLHRCSARTAKNAACRNNKNCSAHRTPPSSNNNNSTSARGGMGRSGGRGDSGIAQQRRMKKRSKDAGAPKRAVLTLYYSPTCGHCTRFLPLFERFRSIARINFPHLTINMINCASTPEMCRSITALPTLILELPGDAGPIKLVGAPKLHEIITLCVTHLRDNRCCRCRRIITGYKFGGTYGGVVCKMHRSCDACWFGEYEQGGILNVRDQEPTSSRLIPLVHKPRKGKTPECFGCLYRCPYHEAARVPSAIADDAASGAAGDPISID